MKKLIAVLSITALFLFVSCMKNADSRITNNNQNKEFEALKEQLVSLNNSLPQRTGEEITKVRWWQCLIIAAADAGGYLWGKIKNTDAITTGCTASITVWDYFNNDETSTDVPTGVDTSAATQTSFSINDDHIALSSVEGVGFIHNKVILDLYDDLGASMFSLSTNELLPLVAQKVSTETGRSLHEIILSARIQKKIVDEVVNAYATSNTLDEFIDNLKLSAPDRAELLDIANVILEGFEAIDAVEDNGQYCETVQGIISESDIPSESKEILNSTASVANASSRLWTK